MTSHLSDDLFLQVRTAHRLLAAYYQRLLPTIEQIAKDLDTDYYFWTPKEFDRTCQLTSDPFSRWKWDMLPALSTYYVFKNVKDVNQIRVGEYLVEFMVDSDSGVASDIGNGNEPDALNLPTSVDDASSILKISIYAPYQDEDKNWYHYLWRSCDFASSTEFPKPQKDKEMLVVSSAFEIQLSSLLQDNAVDTVVNRVKQYIQATVELAHSLTAQTEKSE